MGKVAPLSLKFSGLPDNPALNELKNRPQWVAWKYAERDGNITKPPVNPHNGFGASHTDPTTWGTYQEAAEWALKHNLPGVGYVISEDDEFTGADLDGCRDVEFGGVEPWAQDIIDLAETYCEVSPSGTGLRLIWRGKIDKTIKCDPVHVEVYRNKRYLTITGDHVVGTPIDIRPAPQTEIALRLRVESHKPSAPDAPIRPASGGIISRALTQMGGRDGPQFFRSVNSLSLQNLSRWVPDLFGSMAEPQAGTGAWRISSKTLGRSLEEDLSIAPNGIVDFGVHDMGDPRLGKRTPIDMVLEFGQQSTAADAALWLCERINASPESLGWKSRSNEQSAPSSLARQDIATVDFFTLLTEDVIEEPDYIEPDFAGPGGFVLIAGPPKAQKSFLLQEILVASAVGGRILSGRFSVPNPLRIFCLQAEMNRKLLRKRARVFQLLTSQEKSRLQDNLIISERFHMILNEDGVKIAIETIRRAFPKMPPDIIAVDPLANVFDQENESDNAQMMRFIHGRLEAIRQAINPLACIILVHHAAKRSSEDMARDPFVAIRGAGALRGYYDSAIVIFRKNEQDKTRQLHFELRGGESPEPMSGTLVDGRFQEDVEAEIDISVMKKMLSELQSAWIGGRPLSVAIQTRDEGRYAPFELSRKFGVPAKKVKDILTEWLRDRTITIEIASGKTKLKGIKVLGVL